MPHKRRRHLEVAELETGELCQLVKVALNGGDERR